VDIERGLVVVDQVNKLYLWKIIVLFSLEYSSSFLWRYIDFIWWNRRNPCTRRVPTSHTQFYVRLFLHSDLSMTLLKLESFDSIPNF
jgi:hypothetical protein